MSGTPCNERTMIDEAYSALQARHRLGSRWRETFDALSVTQQCYTGSMLLWASYAFQSVQMPATYEAALMATNSGPAARGERLPWPSFRILVSEGLVPSERGGVFSVIISQADGKLMVLIFERGCVTARPFDTIEEMFDNENPENLLSIDGSDEFTSDHSRVWSVVSSLICGTILAVNQARESEPRAYSALPERFKHGRPRANTHKLGKPLVLDCRQAVRDYVTGARKSQPSVATLRRGHWRNQPHGTRSQMRRRQWIHPTWVGDGPVLVRPTVIGAGGGHG